MSKFLVKDMGDGLGMALCEAAGDPNYVRRVVLDLKAGSAGTIHFETFADEKVLDVQIPEGFSVVEPGVNIPPWSPDDHEMVGQTEWRGYDFAVWTDEDFASAMESYANDLFDHAEEHGGDMNHHLFWLGAAHLLHVAAERFMSLSTIDNDR